ncbi:chaoptin-like [Anopheles cruzii]|uniref:chaoptin-like n=1 Tax=Anopheles cruzii TaxID=68878 RepID=UPI0022EC6663|nr:chaoptin-like [Anopheles cruzii]
MPDIPSEIFSLRPLKLSLVQCGIQQISQRSLQSASVLSELNLAQNNITELKNDVFEGASKLSMLNLTANSISVIESYAFQYLTSLTVLLLAQNKLQTLAGNVFSSLTALSTINLASNELHVLEEGLFSTNAHLTTIQLQNNQINTVDENMFYSEADSQLPSLEYIILRDNNITEINIPNVRVSNLILSNNRITHIHVSSKVHYLEAENNRISSITFDNVAEAELQQLKLKNNSISSLDVIGQLEKLETLDVSYNSLDPLKVTTFGMLKHLTVLDLAKTNISNLQHGTFGHQEALTWLDLSYNNLDQLDIDVLVSSSRLKSLYLEGNPLTHLEFSQMKTYFPELKDIGIGDNDWSCAYLTKLVAYCNEQSIELYKAASLDVPKNQPHVKGVYCFDDKHLTRNWTTAVQHLYNDTDRSAGDALELLFRNVLADVRRSGSDHFEAINKTLDVVVFNLTKQLFQMQSDLDTLRQTQLETQLTYLSNHTQNSNYSMEELKRVIESTNNLRLDKQELAIKTMEFNFSQQLSKVDEALEMAKKNGAKLTVLEKRIEQLVDSVVKSKDIYSILAAEKQTYQTKDNIGSPNEGNALIGTVLAIVCLMLSLQVFVMYNKHRRSQKIKRSQASHENTSLTTIVDHQI